MGGDLPFITHATQCWFCATGVQHGWSGQEGHYRARAAAALLLQVRQNPRARTGAQQPQCTSGWCAATGPKPCPVQPHLLDAPTHCHAPDQKVHSLSMTTKRMPTLHIDTVYRANCFNARAFRPLGTHLLVPATNSAHSAPVRPHPSETWRSLVRSMLTKEAGQRPTASELLAQPCLQVGAPRRLAALLDINVCTTLLLTLRPGGPTRSRLPSALLVHHACMRRLPACLYTAISPALARLAHRRPAPNAVHAPVYGT